MQQKLTMNYLYIVTLMLIAVMSTANATEHDAIHINEITDNLPLDAKNQARTKNELTEEEIFIKSWSNYIGLWSYLIGIFVLPTFITMTISPLMGRKTRELDINQPEILTKLSIIQNMWQKLDVKDPMCRKRVICEVYSGESRLGITAKNLAQAVYYISTHMPESFRSLFNEYIEAMRVGKLWKNCSRYAACAYFTTG